MITRYAPWWVMACVAAVLFAFAVMSFIDTRDVLLFLVFVGMGALAALVANTKRLWVDHGVVASLLSHEFTRSTFGPSNVEAQADVQAPNPAPVAGDFIDRAYSQAAAQDKGHGPKMFAAAKTLSDGDKSVLLTALAENEDNAILTTSVGSPNDRFWALLANVGWMTEASSKLPEALRTSGNIVAYDIPEDGRETLKHAVAGMFKK